MGSDEGFLIVIAVVVSFIFIVPIQLVMRLLKYNPIVIITVCVLWVLAVTTYAFENPSDVKDLGKIVLTTIHFMSLAGLGLAFLFYSSRQKPELLKNLKISLIGATIALGILQAMIWIDVFGMVREREAKAEYEAEYARITTAIQQTPKNFWLYLERGDLQGYRYFGRGNYQFGKPEAQLADYRTAFSISPKNYDVNMRLGTFYQPLYYADEKGLRDSARSAFHFKQAKLSMRDSLALVIRQDTLNAPAYLEHARIAEELGDTLTALSNYKSILPINMETNYYRKTAAQRLGEYYLRHNDIKLCNTYYDMAFSYRDRYDYDEKVKDQVFARLRYRGQQKQYVNTAEALKDFLEAEKRNPNDYYLLNSLSNCYETLGNNEQAEVYRKRASEVYRRDYPDDAADPATDAAVAPAPSDATVPPPSPR
jgi:tetratricopeptide (TPR) repeat protein